MQHTDIDGVTAPTTRVAAAVAVVDPRVEAGGAVAAAARDRGTGKVNIFDLMELAPAEGPASCAYLAARLAYKLMGYATLD
jgi:hypothetical protein